MTDVRWVLSAAAREKLREVLAFQPARSEGWSLVEVRLTAVSAEARFRNPAHGEGVLRLAHVDEEVAAPHLRTADFRITPHRDTAPLRVLATAVGRRLARADVLWWHAREPRASRDAEHVALLAGLRSAIRATIHRDEVDAALERFRRQSLHVIVADDVTRNGAPDDHLTLCIARDVAGARALAEAIAACDEQGIGRQLGYPECCVTAFLRRNARSSRDVGEYGGAVAAWAPNPALRLNNLLFGERMRYISFEPCGYACERALGVADAIAAALFAVDPAYVEIADRALASSIAIRPDGIRARVTLVDDRITAARPVPQLPDKPLAPDDGAFADALVGCTVAARGAVHDPSGRSRDAAVVVPFGAFPQGASRGTLGR